MFNARVTALAARGATLVSAEHCQRRPEQGAKRAFTGPKPGGVTFIQRLASSLALNVHFHSVLLDGVCTETDGACAFGRPPLRPMTRSSCSQRRWVAMCVELSSEPASASTSATPELDSLAIDDPTLAVLYGSSVASRRAAVPDES